MKKYILITTSKEYSSDDLMDWLVFFNLNVTRYNTDCSSHINIDVGDSNLFNKDIFIRKVGGINSKKINTPISNYVNKEVKEFWVELINNYSKNIVFGSSNTKEPNRIKTLEIAKEQGFLVPKYIITSSKEELISFTNKCKKIITKPLIAPYYFKKGETSFIFRASKINLEDITPLNEEFYPTFFQELIERDFEARVFYFKGKCWSIAMFGDKEDLDVVDIWHLKKRREVPLSIPKNISDKVHSFMQNLGYNTGSIDFLVKDKYWFFLELNPAGEYDFVSKRGNYYLNYEIVKEVINGK